MPCTGDMGYFLMKILVPVFVVGLIGLGLGVGYLVWG